MKKIIILLLFALFLISCVTGKSYRRFYQETEGRDLMALQIIEETSELL